MAVASKLSKTLPRHMPVLVLGQYLRHLLIITFLQRKRLLAISMMCNMMSCKKKNDPSFYTFHVMAMRTRKGELR